MSNEAIAAKGTAEAAVSRLELELARRKRGRVMRWLIGVLVVAALASGIYAYRRSQEPPPKPRFATRALQIRDIVQKVESTGRLKPLTQVQVGAQVSGRVVAVYVDFNSQVKKGDLLAEIDSQLAGAQVGEVAGQLKAAKATQLRAEYQRDVAKKELVRLKALRAAGIVPQSELDQAQSAYDVADAEIAGAKATISGLSAQLRSAKATLAYTKIYSPIDGIVINRAVEPGQTVAASFSAPVLFEIAQDLSKMQVLADVDEADVGKLKDGLKAEVEVDAFVGQIFEGTVTQIRYSPNEVQGVVTYSAVIDVANPELKLRPGMTATVSVTTQERQQVLAVSNAALRFKPEDKAEAAPKQALKHGQGRVYFVKGGAVGHEELDSRVIDLGITDGVWTEVLSKALKAGQEFVTEQRDKKKRRKFMGLF